MMFVKLWKGAHCVLKTGTRQETSFHVIMCFPVSTRATGGRFSASCLQCSAKHFPFFLSFLHREEEPIWCRGEIRQTQNNGRGFVPWHSYTVPGTKTMTWEARRDFSCPMHVTDEPTMPQWVTSQEQKVTRAQVARAVRDFALKVIFPFKKRREHFRHKTWWSKRANDREQKPSQSNRRRQDIENSNFEVSCHKDHG